MNLWKIFAWLTGVLNEHLLLRIEWLEAENRVYRSLFGKRVPLDDAQRSALGRLGKRVGRKILEAVATVATPDTILAWYRRLIAKKFDGSKRRGYPGRPRLAGKVESLILRFARENRSWGYDRIAGALLNVGYVVSDQTVGNVLRRHGIAPAPERGKRTTWLEFLKTHLEVLTACDFFTAEVMTPFGLVTYYVLLFIRPATREVHVGGITVHPDETWMKQVARNVTMAGWGFLEGCRYLIHDRDAKFCEAFRAILRCAGIQSLPLPPHSPNLNAFAERVIQSVKVECLDRLILLGRGSLERALEQWLEHYHSERNHQGTNNMILRPRRVDRVGALAGPIRCRERLGGMLRFYHRAAA